MTVAVRVVRDGSMPGHNGNVIKTSEGLDEIPTHGGWLPPPHAPTTGEDVRYNE